RERRVLRVACVAGPCGRRRLRRGDERGAGDGERDPCGEATPREPAGPTPHVVWRRTTGENDAAMKFDGTVSGGRPRDARVVRRRAGGSYFVNAPSAEPPTHAQCIWPTGMHV